MKKEGNPVLYLVEALVVIAMLLLPMQSLLAAPATIENFNSDFLEIAKATGVTIRQDGNALIWEGPYAGKTKPQGPLAGKKVGVIVASEFSDMEAYYLASYLSEFGTDCHFLGVDWVLWKHTRPNVKTKGVQGLFGLSVDPVPTMGARHQYTPLREANPTEFDALIIPGGHSGDVMMTEGDVINFIKTAYENGAIVGGIGGGIIPLIRAGIMNGKKATGDAVVDFMLERIGTLVDEPVVRDGDVITARGTINTPEFVRELCRAFDPAFDDNKKDILKGKKILIVAGEDFEDIELAVPVLEYLYRGAELSLGTFPPPLRSRPPMLGLNNVIMGNFGMSVPLQEIPGTAYKIVNLYEVNPKDYDVIQIPGAFCPWNMVVAGIPVEILKKFYDAGKIVAGICHAPIPIAKAGLLEGRKAAGWLASQDAVSIMGGDYSWDYSAVIDGPVVTARVPDDLPEFLDAVTMAILSKE